MVILTPLPSRRLYVSQCRTGALLRSVLVVVFLASSCGKRRCNYKEILGSYRELIFVELQSLVGMGTQLSILLIRLQLI